MFDQLTQILVRSPSTKLSMPYRCRVIPNCPCPIDVGSYPTVHALSMTVIPNCPCPCPMYVGSYPTVRALSMTILPKCNQRLPATKEQVVCLDVGLICSLSLFFLLFFFERWGVGGYGVVVVTDRTEILLV